ncbi:bll2662 [Bradyrhizobium diazoefficiens USDA 110]|uniref:Bll2662 protein n=3 Tax=Nitrobacteraceae TaxID=41294 RepID=Q89RV0_BRADU|nr:arylsulfatase [Bradyrhizobium diazoefficiens]QBP21490.1 arylsulfatase [Bradyrhizobium diazoefficiens]BAC47927.1 bll2662 [Bradyrhizobium diazoefficiens USDA 110]
MILKNDSIRAFERLSGGLAMNFRAIVSVLFLASAISPAFAQQAQPTTPPPGSPAATITIPGDQLPPPPQKFGGKIEQGATNSKPYWPARIVPPKNAPNVLLIITDDAGYGVPSTFGGVIPTPALDRIAANGLRYTNFHSTALCSPTRAALITGRNHHSAGFGVVAEQATGFPGYDSIITKDKATIGRILTDNGYHTAWFGKNHNTPEYQASQAGPFDQWPTGMGFEYFYGFMGGDTSQWQSGTLVRNTTPIYPFVDKPGWNLMTAMADEAIDYMNRMNALSPDQPFLIKFAPGATHAPHHPTKEWVDKISAMHLFDDGWNKLRETIFANQKKLGVIPQNAKLTPWPKDLIKEWDQLSADEKKLFVRQADVFAAYAAYADNEIGRVIQAVEDMGKLDNTLIIYIEGDNGTSAEGQPNGTPNEMAMFNGANPSVEDQLKYFYDVWGTDRTYNHMSIGWAWAFDTPFSWTKQIVSHFGGTRQGMAISWPKVITDKGGIRNQFHHVIDIVPTILEAAKIKQPDMVDGIKQSPIEGVSMMYTFDKTNANAPTTHKTQYFEMMADRAIYDDGWIASTTVIRPPWVTVAKTVDPANFQWELYDLRNDWTQSDDLAAKNPAKLKELQELFIKEATKYQVFPLDSTLVARALAPRPSLSAGRSQFVWTRPITGTPNGDAPSILNTSYNFKAEIEIPQGGSDGMLITQGGRFAGYGFYVLKNKPVFTWNLVDLKRVRWEGPDLTPGKHILEFDFRYDGLGPATMAFGDYSGVGKGGTGVLKVDGTEVATQKMEHTLPFILQFDESLDIGSDTGTPVDDNDYSTPFTFTGKLNKITLNIDRPKLSPEDIKRLQAAARAAGDGPSADAETAPTGGTAPQVSGDIGLNLAQKVELRIDKLEGCRKQAKGLGLVERVQFVRKCME